MRGTQLDLAERHVQDGRDLVERQERRIAEQKARGRATTHEEQLLAIFKHSLAIYEADLVALRRERTR